MRERVAREAANHLVSRPGNGRVLSVSIHPRADGGWVVTLQDITERERAQRAPHGAERPPAAARGGACRGAEYALRCGHQQHVAGHVPVRCRAADRVRNQPLRGDLRTDARAGEAGHDPARDLRRPRVATAPTTIETGEFVRDGLARFGGARRRSSSWRTGASSRSCGGRCRRRPAQHARGHHRARAAQRPARAAERAAERARARAATHATCSSMRPSTTWCRAWPCTTASSGSSSATSAMPRCTACRPSR